MSRRRTDTARPLAAVLDDLVERMGYRAAIDGARAVEAWPLVCGPTIAGVTERAWMRDGRLHVKVKSAPWRHQLHLQREAWRDRLNHHLGSQVVSEIVFC
jgi:predicted nucleic acid-binding Zn ribbon protein